MRAARIGRCLEEALAFDPSGYFEDPRDRWSVYEPGGLVDASYDSALRGPQWSFAIDPECPGGSGPMACAPDKLQLLMRVVAWKTPAELPAGYRSGLHGTLEATLRFLDIAASWRETDLKTCPGAVAALLSLEDAHWFEFEDSDRDTIMGKPVNSLLVVADGESVTVRARGFAASTYTASELSNGEGTSGWALQMMKVAAPCLKPSGAPPPWRSRPAGG